MKRLTLILLISCAWLSSFAQNEETVMKKFQMYQENPAKENLLSLIDLASDSKDDTILSAIILGNVYLNELEKQLGILHDQQDSLSYGNIFGYANLLLAAHRYDESIELYDRLNTAAPDWSCPWRHKGEALYKTGRFAEAETSTLKAIETREDHFDAYLQLARIQRELGKYEEALQTLEAGLKYTATDAEGEVTDEDFLKLKEEIIKLSGK
ncbi:MAG TPA: hypothetical protein PLD62_08330 [Candidatus Cloacimonadota bacterium]|nr:hypothetical protein [Candidatus Cloacimonadota bacterium]